MIKEDIIRMALEALESGDGWRQSEAITALREALNASLAQRQRSVKPLTDEEIGNDPIFRAGVRFAESKHGIGEKK